MKARIWGKKIILTTLLTIFLLVSLFFPKGVQAQMVVTDIPGLLFETGKWIADKSWDLLQFAWKYGGAITYRNALNLYLGQIAKETAEYVATGGKGQKPMFMTDPDYWSKMGDQVLGEWIDNTAKSFTGFTGKSLCDPIDPTIKFNILIGMDKQYQGMMFSPDMRCSFSTIKKRLKEVSKKKLFDFSIELKEGRAARYRSELAHQVEGEPSLVGAVKEKILKFADYLAAKDEEFAKNIEDLKKIQEGARTVSSNVLDFIKADLEADLSDTKKERDALKNTSLAKAAICYAKDKDAFCADTSCRSICSETYNESECKTNFGYCTEAAKKTADFFKRTLEWSDGLITGVEGILDNFADFEPTPPPTLEDINKDYNPEASDIAVLFKIESELFKKQAEAIEKSKFMQGLTGDINRLTTKVSGLTLTPGSGIRAQYEDSIKKGTAGPIEYTGVAVADAIGVFTNTLFTKLLQQLFTKGLNPAVSPEIAERTTPFLTSPGEFVAPTQEESSVLYADLAVATIKRGNEISIYDEFAVCPEDKKYALPTNCLIDNKLVRAIEEKLTIQQAMERTPTSLLDPGLLVGKPGDYSSLLSWINVKKLRRVRIFPLGLEIAAKKLFNRELGDVEMSLQEIVNAFNNSSSEFYHLVDPNWVLKASTYQCGAMGYSSIPMAGSTHRQESCLDLKDCINEDEDGQCDTWAYCTREKNIWRMNGTQCDTQYDSCQTYQKTSDKSNIAYLTNTLDFSDCDQNNAGCKWYCSNWDENLNEGSWACVEPGQSRQFSSNGTCSGSTCTSQDGCLCTDATTKKGCLVANNQTTCTYPIYTEYADADNSIFFNNKIKECSEQDVGCHEYIRTAPGLGTNLIFNGSFELDTNVDGNPDGWDDPGWNGAETIDTNYHLDGDVSYKFEHTGAHGTPAYTGRWQVVQVIPGQEYTISARIKIETSPSDATINYYFDDDGIGYREGNQGENTIILDGSETNWQRHTQTITIPANRPYIWIAPIIYGDGVAHFDNIKFETGETASSYRYYSEINKVYLKDALSCSVNEVGCELYTPNNGDPLVPGIIESKDKCSFNCLGYETFQQVPSHFDTEPAQWVNLIPSTAEPCSFPGCEEFTNLDTENREYYSYLRQCVKTNTQDEAVINNDGTAISTPDPDLCQLYYTWVGTETGYQLRQYHLKKATEQYTGDPDVNGPVKVSLTPNPEWGDCDEGNALINPHCKQFYDASGKIYYRLYKNTVSCTESCSLYRRSIDQTTQMADVSEGEACNKQNIGCLEYKGPTAGNVYQVFLDDFEDGEIGGWSPGSNSNESVNFPGHSLNVSSSTSRLVAGLVKKGQTYFVYFWIKGTSRIDVSFDSLSTVSKTGLNPGDWQEVKLGPFYFDVEPDQAESLTIENSSFYLDNIILKEVQDNPYLIKDSWQTSCECDTLANHGDFSTGALGCSSEDVAEDSMVGCQVYQDREGQNRYLKSFSRLCSESVIGCESLIDTQNSAWALSQTFNPGGYTEDDVSILVDELIYLVNDEKKECGEEKKGCQKFGLPTLNVDQEVISYTDIYLVNDPDAYTNGPILCLKEDLGCDEYEGQFYFRDPGDKTCEYREDIAIGTDKIKTGWFKKGTDLACYYNSSGEPYEPNEITYGIYPTENTEYEGWVGLCPKVQSGCVEFIDPLGQNLAVNGGLEIDNNNDNMPDGYVMRGGSPSGGTSALTPTESHTGSLSYKVNAPSEGGYYGIYSDGIKVFQNREYTVSAYVKTETISSVSGNPAIGLRLHCHDNGGHAGGNGHFSWDSGERFITTSNQDWTRVWGTFTTNSDTNHCHILPTFHNTDSGTAYFDNIKLIELLSNKGKYYYLNNAKLDKSSCQYRAGLKQGCVLFNDTSQSSDSLIYDSAGSYAASAKNNDLLTTAETTNPGQGDANIAIKVSRDRACGEWLSCIGSRVVWDRSTGSYREECEFVGRCDDLIGSGESAQCGHIIYQAEPKVLDQDLYQDRDVSWAGMDYSGHSLYDMYPIERLYVEENPPASGIYQVTFDGVDGGGVDGQGTKLNKSCQVFPEKDSPFPQSVAGEGHEYPDVNICSEDGGTGSYTDCQCSYVKAEYSGQVKYYNYGSDPADNICVSIGANASKTIRESCSGNECGEGGSCSGQTKETEVIGVRGWCLEKDPSKPDDINACITWWPGPSIGDPDIQYQAAEAGRTIGTDTYYCLHTQSRTTEQDRFFCLSDDGGNCDVIMKVPANSKMAATDESTDIYLKNYRTDLSTVGSVAGVSLGTNREAILTRVTVASFPGGLVQETGLKAAYVPPGTHKMWKYSWDVRTYVTEYNSTSWCGSHHKCSDWLHEVPCTSGWHFIDYDCSTSGENCGAAKWRDGWSRCNPGTEPYYVSPVSGYLQSGLSSCPSQGCLQYCDALAMAPGQGVLATDRYYQWKEVSPNIYNSDLLACQSGQSSELGVTKRCGYENYWPDGDGAMNSLCSRFSRARQGALNEKIPVGDASYYNCVAVGANSFFSCGTECKSGVALQSASVGAGKLDDLFRKFDVLDWDGSNYTETSTWDVTGSGFGGFPEVGSVVCDDVNECEVGTENRITIGGLESGNIERSQTYPAILKFYAWADKDHMPIKEIVVEWADNQVTGQGSWVKAKNHKDVCIGSDFANVSDSCTEEYFQFVYIYNCFGQGSEGWNSPACSTAGVTGACCYQPKVWVKDNWGWCSTDSAWASETTSCRTAASYGTPYDGIIIIRP